MKWRPIITGGLICAAGAGVVLWVIHARLVGHWIQVHTGTVDEPGPYYGFWSGFGSDLTEFGIIGAIATGVYARVAHEINQSVTGYMVGDVLTSVIAGVVVFSPS